MISSNFSFLFMCISLLVIIVIYCLIMSRKAALSLKKQKLVNWPAYIAYVWLVASSILLIIYVFQTNHKYFFGKWGDLFFVIVFLSIGVSVGNAFGKAPLEILDISLSSKTLEKMQNNPIANEVVGFISQMKVGAIICEPECVKIYSEEQSNDLPKYVFNSEEWQKNDAPKDGRENVKEYYRSLLIEGFIVKSPCEKMISFKEKGFQNMREKNMREFCEYIRRYLGEEYVVLEHIGNYHYDTSKEEAYSTGGYTKTSTGFVENCRTAKIGEQGNVKIIFYSIVKKEKALETIANIDKTMPQKKELNNW